MKWTYTQQQREREEKREGERVPRVRVSKRGQEERKEGVFRIVIGAVEVISDLKSSRCGPASEKRKNWRKGEKSRG